MTFCLFDRGCDDSSGGRYSERGRLRGLDGCDSGIWQPWTSESPDFLKIWKINGSGSSAYMQPSMSHSDDGYGWISQLLGSLPKPSFKVFAAEDSKIFVTVK